MAMRILRDYTLAPVEGHDPAHAYNGITAVLPNGLPVRVTPRA